LSTFFNQEFNSQKKVTCKQDLTLRDRDPPRFLETETRPRPLKNGSRDRLEIETLSPRSRRFSRRFIVHYRIAYLQLIQVFSRERTIMNVVSVVY